MNPGAGACRRPEPAAGDLSNWHQTTAAPRRTMPPDQPRRAIVPAAHQARPNPSPLGQVPEELGVGGVAFEVVARDEVLDALLDELEVGLLGVGCGWVGVS